MSLESCFERADFLIQYAEQFPSKSLKQTPATKWKSLRRKAHGLFSEALRTSPNKKLRATSGILTTLAKKNQYSKLLINLFPKNDGYSISLIKNDETYIDQLNLSYDEQEIVEYIDNGELPPLLSETLHRCHSDAFQCGAVLAEIHDFRIASDENNFETRYVLLQPTQRTMNDDVNIIAEETSNLYKWGVDDKLALESCLTLATSEPLCLDTSPTVAIVKNRLQNRRKIWNSKPFQRCLRRNGAVSQRRREVLKTRDAPQYIKLHDFLKKRKNLKRDQSSVLSSDVKLPLDVFDLWRKTPLDLTVPEYCDVEAYAKPFPLPKDFNEDVIEVQSILLESEGTNRDVCSRITIGQRPRDMHYFGMLQSNKYFKHSVMGTKTTQQMFSLGTEHRANLYILQYQELFTEDGRRPAKVSVIHSNQPPIPYHIPNQLQPWQLSQDRSVYSVGSVINIPINKWKKINNMDKIMPLELGHKTTNPNQHQNPINKQKQNSSQGANSLQVAQTPTLNAITLQNSSQSAFNFSGVSGTPVTATGRRLSRVKSNNTMDNIQPQAGRRSRQSSEILSLLQPKTTLTTNQNQSMQDGTIACPTIVSQTSTQSYTINSSTLALNALNQMGTVSLQLPVMTVTSQSASTNASHLNQIAGQPTTTVLRMPVGITNTSSSSGQLTAAINLISGGSQNVLSSNVLGNIQLTTGMGGGITIPANQLPANLAMQLTSVSNTSGNPQQISLVAAPASSNTQQISLVNQQVSNATPFTIVTNNDTWQIQEAGSSARNNQQQV